MTTPPVNYVKPTITAKNTEVSKREVLGVPEDAIAVYLSNPWHFLGTQSS